MKDARNARDITNGKKAMRVAVGAALFHSILSVFNFSLINDFESSRKSRIEARIEAITARNVCVSFQERPEDMFSRLRMNDRHDKIYISKEE